MAGGLVEYGSMIFGMRSIWLLLAAVYGVAWFASRVPLLAGAGGRR